jgi:hypothetical protein
VLQAKYAGLHALRRFFASWCINPKEKGGRESLAKVVQVAGPLVHHHDDGHLRPPVPGGDDAAEPAAADRAFLARNTVATSRCIVVRDQRA